MWYCARRCESGTWDTCESNEASALPGPIQHSDKAKGSVCMLLALFRVEADFNSTLNLSEEQL